MLSARTERRIALDRLLLCLFYLFFQGSARPLHRGYFPLGESNQSRSPLTNSFSNKAKYDLSGLYAILLAYGSSNNAIHTGQFCYWKYEFARWVLKTGGRPRSNGQWEQRRSSLPAGRQAPMADRGKGLLELITCHLSLLVYKSIVYRLVCPV